MSTLIKTLVDTFKENDGCMRLNGGGVNLNKFDTGCFRPSNC